MKKIELNQERAFRIDMRGMDKEVRMVSAALSSETPVERSFGTEILLHTKDSVNMERAIHGLPLLFSHDRNRPIGRVENIRVDTDKVLRGDLYFSKNTDAQEVWGDVSEGFLRDLSIGYRIDEYAEKDGDIIEVTRFTPLEASVVTVPADSRVGVNRSQEGITMSDDKKTDAGTDTTETRQDEKKVTSFSEHRINQDRERKVGARLEAKRRSEVDDLFSRYEAVHGDAFTELRAFCLDDPECTVERAKEEILNAIAEGYVSVDVSTKQVEARAEPRFNRENTRVRAGEDALDKFAGAAEVAIAIQANGVYTEEERAESQKHEFYSMSVTELAREYLRITGRKSSGRKEDIVGAALQRGISHGSSDFASVLENVANKSMLDGFMQAPESWSAWCQTRNIPDFKTASLLNMSLFGDLDTIREGSQYEHGDMSDIKETIKLATYGKLFGISRVALANDDLNALSDIPRAMGMAAAYKIGDLAYSVLTTGTTTTMLQDSVALFASGHSNYVTAGAAPSVATLNTARTAMATQTDPAGKTLGIRPAYLIGPEALWGTMTTLIAATYDPAGTAGTLTPNPFANSMTVVTDHRLDTANSSGWYLAAASNTVVVGFLNGQQTPYLESRDGWNIDGVEYKVRIDAAATATDYRGLYYNDGVT